MKSSDVVSNQNSTRVFRQVDWRATHIVETEGAVAVYGRDAVAGVSRRKRLHTALDAMLCKMNRTQDDGQRLHAALDKLLDSGEELNSEDPAETQSRILHEPDLEEDEESEDEEPLEDDGEVNEDPNQKTKIPYDKKQVPSLDEFQRSLDAILALDSAGGSRVIAMDSVKDLLLLDPDDVAMDAVQKFPVSYDINKRAKVPWFQSLFTWISKYPKGTKVKDLNQNALQTLLRELQTAA